VGHGPNRLRVTTKVHGKQVEHHFPLTATKQQIAAWKESERVKLRDVRHQPAARGTLPRDVERYLDTLVNRPKLRKDRARVLAWWIARLGQRPRAAIRRDEYTSALAELALTKSASHCNHAHTAMFHLITTLDGKEAPNVMRGVPRQVEDEAEARGFPYALVRAILATLPDLGLGRKGQKRSKVSKTKIRLRLMAYSGITYAQMMRLEMSDLRPGGVFVKRRRKGKGSAGRVKPLNAEAQLALDDFIAAGCMGEQFSASSIWQSFQFACRAVERDAANAGHPISLAGIRPYDLRHCYGTIVFETTGNLQTVMELLDQRSLKTARRYALGAIPAHLEAASKAVEARIAAGSASPDSQSDR
jgi:integrase